MVFTQPPVPLLQKISDAARSSDVDCAVCCSCVRTFSVEASLCLNMMKILLCIDNTD